MFLNIVTIIYCSSVFRPLFKVTLTQCMIWVIFRSVMLNLYKKSSLTKMSLSTY